MKKQLLISMLAAGALCGCGNPKQAAPEEQATDTAVVYFCEEISPEALVRLFDAIGVQPEGNVCVKISSGEGGNRHYLQPSLIGQLVQHVGGTLVECNTAYEGTRDKSAAHWQTIREHGFLDVAPFDIMDEEGETRIPVQDTTWLKYNLVGTHMDRYDFMINLAHFKGHAMGGFGGVLKNASIGVASSRGKCYIHSAGRTEDPAIVWDLTDGVDGQPPVVKQDEFLESMAAAAQAVHEYFKARKGIVYINVMNNMSVDCDCDPNPHAPCLKDMGIVASTDPVACDQACLDMVFGHQNAEGDDAQPLIERIQQLHGTHTVDHAASIGLGTKTYRLVKIQ